MLTLLSKIWIRNPERLTPQEKRTKYGILCSGFGIFLNLFLFGFKLLAGLLVGAVSIVADAFNNLADGASSVVTLLGFRLARHKPDKEHPFGHGRIEYISGLAVSFLILLVGAELLRSSIAEILHPTALEFSAVSLIILGVSVFIKLYMAYYNRRIGKKIVSTAMQSTALDSVLDAVTTTVVFICLIVGHFTKLHIDGWCGLAVAVFILYSGIRSVKETVSPLLGEPPSKDLIVEIEKTVKSFPEIHGVHDIIVHDYGPDRLMVSLHAEVDAAAKLMDIHDVIDRAEKELFFKVGCNAVIHMDPIQIGDIHVVNTLKRVREIVKLLDPSITVHDFRMIQKGEDTNVIFDAVVPRDIKITDEEAKEKLSELVKTMDANFHPVIVIDRAKVI